jgi:hypothetical protein
MVRDHSSPARHLTVYAFPSSCAPLAVWAWRADNPIHRSDKTSFLSVLKKEKERNTVYVPSLAMRQRRGC